MHIEFVKPTKRYADIIIQGDSDNSIAVDILHAKIASLVLANVK